MFRASELNSASDLNNSAPTTPKLELKPHNPTPWRHQPSDGQAPIEPASELSMADLAPADQEQPLQFDSTPSHVPSVGVHRNSERIALEIDTTNRDAVETTPLTPSSRSAPSIRRSSDSFTPPNQH